MFDVAKIIVKAGHGGDGSPSFRREKYVPKGGPDGGDGADGGSIFFVVDEHENTLRSFSGVPKFEAESGEAGRGRQQSGAVGADLEIAVPLGTVIWEGERWDDRVLVGEMLRPQDRFLVARGGKGGRGNVHFKSSTNRTPLEFELGGKGDSKTLWLELKLIADIGLVGLPNAGKSTLLSAVTQAQPKIADYPFTTLEPHLGVISGQLDGESYSYVMADIPGLIEEASEGKGLGHQFLRHIERCRVLLYVLALEEAVIWNDELSDAEKAESLVEQWKLLRSELEAYDPKLIERPALVVVNKQDLLTPELRAEIEQVLERAAGSLQVAKPLFISAQQRLGLDELRRVVHLALKNLPQAVTNEARESEVGESRRLFGTYGTDDVPVYTQKPTAEIDPTLPKLVRRNAPK